MNKLYLLCLLLFVSIDSYADVTFEELNDITTTPEYLEGQFVQVKYLSELDASLTSSGVFNYQRGKSIHWETIEPIKNVLLMTPESIINSQGSNTIVSMQAGSNPAVTILSDIFFSVLTAEWEQLSTYFALSGTLADKQWQVELTPIDKTVMQVVSRVKLTGDSLLRELIFFEKSGDRTTINFDALTQ